MKKPGGVPSISALWREVAETEADLAANAGAAIELSFLEIDNACFQMIANPAQFDVVVTPNMFGDVPGDTSSVLLGSRGMAYSANFGPAQTHTQQSHRQITPRSVSSRPTVRPSRMDALPHGLPSCVRFFLTWECE